VGEGAGLSDGGSVLFFGPRLASGNSTFVIFIRAGCIAGTLVAILSDTKSYRKTLGHNITAIILKGDYDIKVAESFGLFGKELPFSLTLFHIDHYQTACWQHELKAVGQLETSITDKFIFPTQIAISEVVKNVSNDEKPLYAIIQTDYFGGIGNQYASVYQYKDNIDKNAKTINQVLIRLGVKKVGDLDEFDTVGLDKIRSQPDIFDKYVDLADDYGV
jgi:hypothetical protein